MGAQYSASVTISNGQEYIATEVTGVYPNHTKIDKMEMLYGRFINQIDQEEKRKVLVLSNKQAKELEPKKDYQTLLGRYVKVGNFAFKVVGIYKDEESGSSEAFSSYSAIKGIFMLVVLLGAGNGLINAQLNQSARFLSNSMMVRAACGSGTAIPTTCRWSRV